MGEAAGTVSVSLDLPLLASKMKKATTNKEIGALPRRNCELEDPQLTNTKELEMCLTTMRD